MKNKAVFGWLVTGALLVGGATGFYLWQESMKPPLQVLEPMAPPAAPTAQAEPAIRYPIPQSDDAKAKPLPPLDQSDKAIRDELYGLIGLQALNALFNSEHFVRNVVVTIDNLPRKTLAVRLLPTKPATGGDGFVTSGNGDSLSIAEGNAVRYKPFIRVAAVIDAKKLVASYVHYYPLFQRAYEELGYPKGYFNDRLVAVIDHLLDAPEVEGPVRLTQPHVLYKFADPELEGASAGHKIMVRMGDANAEEVKVKLREIRRELTGQALPK